MLKHIIAAAVISVASVSVAKAQDNAETTIVSVRIKPVCDHADTIHLTPAAIKACQGDAASMPKMLKDGSRLSYLGTGREFSVLLSNIELLTR